MDQGARATATEITPRQTLEGAVNRLSVTKDRTEELNKILRMACGDLFGGFPEEPETAPRPVGTSTIDRLHAKIDDIQDRLNKQNEMLMRLRAMIGDQGPARLGG